MENGRDKCIQVIVPLKLEWEPYYTVPEGANVQIGSRVEVIISAKPYIAVVSAIGQSIPDGIKIKDISSADTGLQPVSEEEIELWRQIASYYLCTVGEVYKAAYPAGKLESEESAIKRTEALKARLEKTEALAAKARFERTREKYLIEADEIRKKLNSQDDNCTGFGDITLSAAQQVALKETDEAFMRGKTVLLQGVTGSGKTEIYMSEAIKVMKEGRNVLYLVPEIALSRQLEERLSNIFSGHLLCFHSRLTAARKNEISSRVSDERQYILLGTRSSIFLPHRNLGMIIVDEEHDSSYKQDSPAPRYNGRDAAIMLGSTHRNCHILLGSATPSLESLYNCMSGKFVRVILNKKFHGGESAAVELIDTIAERKKNGMKGSFSIKLIAEINETVAGGGQVMILRQRRSYSPVMQCIECGTIVKCPRCNVSLSYHKDCGKTICHHCGSAFLYDGFCKVCGGALKGLGGGTQKIEEEASALFPSARIARLDSDTASAAGYEERIIREFSAGDIDILIGTQMVSKGFDFGNLKLVAVLQADALLGIQDFRADEKALQLLEQFRGRCSRRSGQGKFIIQTSQPGHPVYEKLVDESEQKLPEDMMKERKDFGYPPFSRIINVYIRDTYISRASRMALGLAGVIADEGIEAEGPFTLKNSGESMPALRIRLPKDRNLPDKKRKLRNSISDFEKKMKYMGHIIIDVDPQ